MTEPAEVTEDFEEATEETTVVTEEAEDVQSESDELEVYEIEDIQASVADIREWKEAFEKKRDTDAAWTQKTQKLSEDKKQFEASQTVLEEKLEMLGAMEGEIEKALLGDLDSVDLDKILDEDGIEEYTRIKRDIDKRKESFAGIASKFREIQDQQYKDSYKHLFKSLGWEDAKKKESDLETIQKHANNMGITQQEFGRVTNPKIMECILDAFEILNRIEEEENILENKIPLDTNQSISFSGFAEKRSK